MKRSEEIKKFQEKELKNGMFESYQSFHADFINCPWIIIRNLSYSLSEGDIATIFEQYGTIVSMELLRDEKTGFSRGTCLMAYEDPRSAVLAVDNFNGISLLGRTINVDHQDYKSNPKSKLTDPRQIIPARLQIDKTDSLKPIFDEGSASPTESDYYSSGSYDNNEKS